MGFQTFGALGGAARKLSAGWKEDRLAEAEKKAAMMQFMLPRAMEQRASRQEKRKKYKEWSRQIVNLGLTEDMARDVLASGEEHTVNFITKTQEYITNTNTALNSVQQLIDAKIIPEDYKSPTTEIEPFDLWFDKNIVGLPGEYTPLDITPLKAKLASHFGNSNPQLLRDSTYNDIASLMGIAQEEGAISQIAADISGTRQPVERTDFLRVRLPEDELAELTYKADLFTFKMNELLAQQTYTVDGKEVPFFIATQLLALDLSNSQILLNHAKIVSDRAAAKRTLTERQETDMEQFIGMYPAAAREISANMAGQYGMSLKERQTPDGTVWDISLGTTIDGFKRKQVVEQALAMVGIAYGEAGNDYQKRGLNPKGNFTNIMAEIADTRLFPLYIASAAAEIDYYHRLDELGLDARRDSPDNPSANWGTAAYNMVADENQQRQFKIAYNKMIDRLGKTAGLRAEVPEQQDTHINPDLNTAVNSLTNLHDQWNNEKSRYDIIISLKDTIPNLLHSLFGGSEEDALGAFENDAFAKEKFDLNRSLNSLLQTEAGVNKLIEAFKNYPL